MSVKIEPKNFLNDLERFARVRTEVAGHLVAIAETLEQAELESEKKSGRLELDRDREDLDRTSKN